MNRPSINMISTWTRSTASCKHHGLEKEVKVNIESNHATLSGHSFEHEIAMAIDYGIFGSIDMNRGDPQNGWDTDQFPNDLREITLALYYVLKGGGFTTGGNNFDAKVRRQSIDPVDLFYGHIGAVDMLARGLLERRRHARRRRNDNHSSSSATPAGAPITHATFWKAAARWRRLRTPRWPTMSRRCRIPAARNTSRTW